MGDGPWGCKCRTLGQRMIGDGCDECQPRSDEDRLEALSDEIEELEREIRMVRRERDQLANRIAAPTGAATKEGE